MDCPVWTTSKKLRNPNNPDGTILDWLGLNICARNAYKNAHNGNSYPGLATAFQTAAADAKYVPAARKATGYTDSNWATVIRNVAAANRVRRDQQIAYGDYLALRKVLSCFHAPSL